MKKTMLTLDTSENAVLCDGGLTVELLPTGDVKQIVWEGQMYNQFVASPASGAVGALYLRRYEGNRIAQTVRLTGLGSPSEFAADARGAVYAGSALGAAYTVRLAVSADTWYYRITLQGKGKYDVLYTFDTGVGDKGFLLSNELYASQYLGHSVFSTQYGFAVESRQNLGQGGGRHPALLQGAVGIEAVGFCTDGLQFFGPEYRVTDTPRLLTRHLPNVNHQYEMAFIALETETFELDGERTLGFFGHAIPDRPEAVEAPDNYVRVIEAFETLDFGGCRPARPLRLSAELGAPLAGREDRDDDFPAERFLEERDKNGALLSAFLPGHVHIVGQRKEALVERPHGNIVTTAFDETELPGELMTSTSYMYGLFNAQTVAGNTSSNKFLSASRGFLNIQKDGGMRLWVRYGGALRQLTEPTLFEMGLNFSRWTYVLPDDTLTVTVWSAPETKQIVTRFASRKGVQYDLLVSMRTLVGSDEGAPLYMRKESGRLLFTPQENTPTANFAPGLEYALSLDCKFEVSDDRAFFDDGKPRDGTLVTLALNASAFTLTVTGGTAGAPDAIPTDFAAANDKYLAFYDHLLGHARFTGADADKLNETLYWYTHNALVHYAVPHGLEQTGGAAWGTRDVCQGPIEFFMTFGRFDTVRKILLKVFSYQSAVTGEWPQWFMFDNYPYAADDCHGDIVFWPLKSLGDYLARTGDASILGEKVPYRGGETVPLTEHVARALSNIEARTGEDGLISYAGGDWDDTLQPVSTALKEKLVSAWTMALAVDTLKGLVGVPTFAERSKVLLERVEQGFPLLVKDGTIAGFGYRADGGVKLLLHPDDDETGIHCRLLPLTRSIIAGLASPEQAERNVERIEARLKCPDGVRLMDAPARYEGGVSKIFARAEQAANVGREIGLQYVHAHIRYIEAMTVLGRACDAWWGLMAVNPVGIADVVENARPRQANAYFSSSEGLFDDRYRYKQDFDRLRDGSIEVRGGWRVYSSGGGIYLARLIGDVFGLRLTADSLVLDPVLPALCDGSTLSMRVGGSTLTVVYHVTGSTLKRAEVDGILSGQPQQNPYRSGGIAIPRSALAKDSRIDVYLE